MAGWGAIILGYNYHKKTNKNINIMKAFKRQYVAI